MKDKFNSSEYIENIIKRKETNKILEDLGIHTRTKLEKLAESFSGVKYSIHDFKNRDTGFIEFLYTGEYILSKDKSSIEKVAKRFYNKEDYLIFVTTSDIGFDISIFDNFINRLIKKKNKDN